MWMRGVDKYHTEDFLNFYCIFIYIASLAFLLRATSIALLVLHTMGIFLTFTFTKIWMPFTLFFELNMIAFVVRCFGVQPSWMILVTALFSGKRYSLFLFFNYSNRYTIIFFSFCILLSSLLLSYLKPSNVKILFRFKDSFSRPGIFSNVIPPIFRPIMLVYSKNIV